MATKPAPVCRSAKHHQVTQNHSTLWASTLIRLIWHEYLEGWKIRNKDKHQVIKDSQLVGIKLEVMFNTS
jgi:hypothetical protein